MPCVPLFFFDMHHCVTTRPACLHNFYAPTCLVYLNYCSVPACLNLLRALIFARLTIFACLFFLAYLNNLRAFLIYFSILVCPTQSFITIIFYYVLKSFMSSCDVLPRTCPICTDLIILHAIYVLYVLYSTCFYALRVLHVSYMIFTCLNYRHTYI